MHTMCTHIRTYVHTYIHIQAELLDAYKRVSAQANGAELIFSAGEQDLT